MEVIGQEEIKARLRRQIVEGRIPHAQLLCGPEGSGKLPMALAFGAALMCQQPVDGKPCGDCADCRMAAGWVHPDLHFAYPVVNRKGTTEKANSDTYLDRWREQLLETPYFDRSTWLRRIGVENQQSIIGVAEGNLILRKLSLKAGRGGRKVIILWLPEQMNAETANMLLKILEEPPADTVFLMVSESPDRLLPTILSRTQRIDFPPLSDEEVTRALVEHNGLDNETARTVARVSQGNYIKALHQLHVDTDEAQYFDMFVLLMRKSYGRQVRDLREWADNVAGWGRERQLAFIDYALRLVRENFVYNFHRPELNHMNKTESDFSTRFARFINERNVIGIMDELTLARRDIAGNVGGKMVFFDLALKIIVLLIQ